MVESGPYHSLTGNVVSNVVLFSICVSASFVCCRLCPIMCTKSSLPKSPFHKLTHNSYNLFMDSCFHFAVSACLVL